jgi:catechol 2,3-dioxygenase-like lactoylglutathione lyase family enzyme
MTAWRWALLGLIKLASLALLAWALWAPPAQAEGQPQIQPWRDAVVSVRDFKPWISFFTEVAQWQVAQRDSVSAAELAYWRLPANARGQAVRMCAPGAQNGCIRFVRFTNAGPQRPIRAAARPWDTGAIYSIMLRVANVQAVWDAAIARGWSAESEPFPFSFGGSSLVNVVLTGPDGVHLALYERVSPPFTGFPVNPVSQGFNTMRMVQDQPKALDFYRRVLGFALQFDAPYLNPVPEPNNFSVPVNLATQIPRQAAVVFPTPGETGRMEVMQFVGLTGRDVSSRAMAPNFGILSVRYPIQGLDAYLAGVKARGGDIVQGPALVGGSRIAAVRDPDGSLTEFVEDAPARR